MLSEILEYYTGHQLEDELKGYRNPIIFGTPPSPAKLLGSVYQIEHYPITPEVPPEYQSRVDAELRQEASRLGVVNAELFVGHKLRNMVNAVRLSYGAK
ncbi:MAG: hypothetical protein WCJ70_03980 [bacterium]